MKFIKGTPVAWHINDATKKQNYFFTDLRKSEKVAESRFALFIGLVWFWAILLLFFYGLDFAIQWRTN